MTTSSRSLSIMEQARYEDIPLRSMASKASTIKAPTTPISPELAPDEVNHSDLSTGEDGRLVSNLPPVDGGRGAWGYLLAATVLETLVWGESFLLRISVLWPKYGADIHMLPQVFPCLMEFSYRTMNPYSPVLVLFYLKLVPSRPWVNTSTNPVADIYPSCWTRSVFGLEMNHIVGSHVPSATTLSHLPILQSSSSTMVYVGRSNVCCWWFVRSSFCQTGEWLVTGKALVSFSFVDLKADLRVVLSVMLWR